MKKQGNNKQNKVKNNEQNDEVYYKGKYHIVFYDRTDERYIAGFNTILDICRFKFKKVTIADVNLLRVELCRALKRKEQTTRMLNGELMHVHLVNMIDDE